MSSQLRLVRTDYLKTGVFGELSNSEGTLSLYTLERAYPVIPDSTLASTSYLPKVPKGTYVCKRGRHKLHGMPNDFETFEVTDVPGHTNILFHVGNFNEESEGCILLGMGRDKDLAVLASKVAFNLFMIEQGILDQFNLVVE